MPVWLEDIFITIKDVYEWIAWFTLVFLAQQVVPFLFSYTPSSWPPLARYALTAFYFGLPFILLSRKVMRRILRLILGAPVIFGQARFASYRELRRAGLLRPGGRFMGQFVRGWFRRRAHDISLHGEGHVLTIAAQGGGKTTGLIIPTLLTYTTGPVVVTDPKGAITAQTRRWRASLGRVVVLNPWRDELAADPSFGLDLGDDGFNPLQGVNATQDGMAVARTVAALLSPDRPGEQSYWTSEARSLLEWGMLWLAVHRPKACTLPRLHDLLFNTGELVKIMEACTTTVRDGPGIGALKKGAGKFYGMIDTGAGAQLSGIIGMATAELAIYDEDTRLAAHVSRDGFRLADLKAGGPLTVFVICPPDHLVGDDRKWLNLILSMICQQVGKPGRAVETVLLMDEFPALGYLPNLAGALEQFREAGLRAHLIAQNPGQIITIYGADGLRRFWGACENKQFFRMTDPQQSAELSAWIGERQTKNYSYNPKGDESESYIGVPLIRPDELLRMGPDRQIILRAGLRPIAAHTLPFFKRPEWGRLVDPNPYRGQS